MSYQWWTNLDAYKRKKACKKYLKGEPVTKHPLEQVKSELTRLYEKRKSIDPFELEEMDPLTKMAVNADLQTDPHSSAFSRSLTDTFEPWASKKQYILSKFTTHEKLSLTTSLFSNEKEIPGISEKTLSRLEQLDLDNGAKQSFGGLSQEEYVNKINLLDQQLSAAWQADLRVNALKIVIQCCKLLGDTSVLTFYPSKFVIVTDILDRFGQMVYLRLKGKQSDSVPLEVARETCKNWFFKIGSIRELLPRLAVELSILKSYCFLTPNPDYGKILLRILNSMWGIGDPVVSIYLRCYLCRIGMNLVPDDKELLLKCFQDLLLLHNQALEHFRNSPNLAAAKISMDTFIHILTPAVDWIMQCLVHRGDHLNYTLQLIYNVPPFWKSILLGSVLNTFPPSFIAEECLNILDMILTLETNVGETLRGLGYCLLLVEPQQSVAKEAWQRVWPLIQGIPTKESYYCCCQAWGEFVVKHFSLDKLNAFLENLLEHLSIKDIDQFNSMIYGMVEKILIFSPSIAGLVQLNPFLKLITMLNVSIIKSVFSWFNSKHETCQGDSVLINTLLHLASLLHDSVDALTLPDEVKQIADLINGFILRVDYKKDFEKQLQFYDEARGYFSGIDAVLVQLIQCVLKLGMTVCYVVGGHHTKRTRGFLSACIAYSFITIPSLENEYVQLHLYLLTSQIAYANHCISQGDSCIKATITLLNDVKTDPEERSHAMLQDFMYNILSTLLAVPDHPMESILYLLKALMTIGCPNASIGNVPVTLKSLCLLGAYAQPEYPYNFNKAETNLDLYGGAEQYIDEINSIASTYLNDSLVSMKQMADQNMKKEQGRLCLDLFWYIVYWGDAKKMENLAVNLWNLASKTAESRMMRKSLDSLKVYCELADTQVRDILTQIEAKN